jgi:type I restriction enzyme S subunit
LDSWKKYILDDVADIKLSNVDKKIKENEREISLCNYTDVYKNAFINFDKSKNFMIATCNDNEYKKFLLKKGQVAITKDSETRDDIGISTYIEDDFDSVILGYHLSLITPNEEKISGKFLNYWLNTKQAKIYFKNNAGGSGQRCSLPLDIIKSIPLMFPNISIQKKISNILFKIDKKIEINNKINQKLEAIAKTLYDYWFVQFDFPNSEGKPYKSSGGKMVYSEELKREIPEGWGVSLLKHYAEIQRGDIITLKDSDITGEIKVVSAGINYSHFHSDYNREKNTITLSSSGANAGYINFWREPIFASDCITIRGESDIETIMILHYLYLLQDYIYSQAKGSAQPHVYPNDIKQLYYPIPLNSLIKKFGKIILPLNNQIANNQKENQKLTQLRDWLLPMLMNGQVRVK